MESKQREKEKIRELIKQFKANGNKMLKKKIMKQIFEDVEKKNKKERKENLAKFVHNMNNRKREKKLNDFEKNYATMGPLYSEQNMRMLNGKLRSDLKRSLRKLAKQKHKQKQIKEKYDLEFSFPDTSIQTMRAYRDYIDNQKGSKPVDLRPQISLTNRVNKIIQQINNFKNDIEEKTYTIQERQMKLKQIANLEQSVMNLEIEASDLQRSDLKSKFSELNYRILKLKDLLKKVAV